MAESDVVSKPPGQADQSSDPVAKYQEDRHQPNGGDALTGGTKQSISSRLQGFRTSIQDHGISDESFKIISAAWRKSTEKSYSSAWGKWMLWCNRTNTDPFLSSVGPVLSFLTEQFQEGKQYTTLNSYRSALSATLQPIDGKPIGQHPIVCRLLQGMFNQRPPAPRYQEVWDVSLVVRHIQSGPPTAELALKELSKRLVTLLALCNASRASDLRALDTRFKQPIGGGIKFTIPGLTKTRRSGPPREVFSQPLMKQMPSAR